GPAPHSDVAKANIYLTDFEKEVARAQGADMGRYLNRRETLTRIRELARLYPDAPKVILSTEIVALDTNFFSVRKRSCEAVEKAVSKAFLKEVHDVIVKNDLPRWNGFDEVTSGLPVQYSSCSLSVDYASGERLYFRMDGDPEAEWARQLKTLFLREISANGTPINPSV
ncbi:MAG: hypothetical protein IIV56_05790, partial [Mailhella sp.]|nr:hypothetical protein [Mailhella sp.]